MHMQCIHLNIPWSKAYVSVKNATLATQRTAQQLIRFLLDFVILAKGPLNSVLHLHR